jgi:hypothetical protein
MSQSTDVSELQVETCVRPSPSFLSPASRIHGQHPNSPLPLCPAGNRAHSRQTDTRQRRLGGRAARASRDALSLCPLTIYLCHQSPFAIIDDSAPRVCMLWALPSVALL